MRWPTHDEIDKSPVLFTLWCWWEMRGLGILLAGLLIAAGIVEKLYKEQSMPIIETAVAKCDACGKEASMRICSGSDGTHYPLLPPRWTRAAIAKAAATAEELEANISRDWYFCPAHSIQVTHNGDAVTLVPQDGESP